MMRKYSRHFSELITIPALDFLESAKFKVESFLRKCKCVLPPAMYSRQLVKPECANLLIMPCDEMISDLTYRLN